MLFKPYVTASQAYPLYLSGYRYNVKYLYTLLFIVFSATGVYAQNGSSCAGAIAVSCSELSYTGFSDNPANTSAIAGTCLNNLNEEGRSVWYTWTSADEEALAFIITPQARDDIDWVLYELPPATSCANLNAGVAIRCSAAQNCNNQQTGMQAGEGDNNEGEGCDEGQNGFVQPYKMKAGFQYYLLIYNVTSDAGFAINFSGSATFVKADFRTTQNIRVKTVSPFTVDFENTSTGVTDNYLWDFGDGTTSSQENPNHTFTYTRTDGRAQYFKVSLTVSRNGGCASTVQKGPLALLPGITVFVPNTITPNGDGINDELVATITNLLNYRLSIYNRYGTRLFETRDIFVNWNGTYRNTPVPAGVYYYLITGTMESGNAVQRSGSVTVIR